MIWRTITLVAVAFTFAGDVHAQATIAKPTATIAKSDADLKLPRPYATPSANSPPKVIGWPAGKTPKAPAGFRVEPFSQLDHPRWIYVLPDGNLLVSQSSSDRRHSPNKITLLGDADGDGKAEIQKVVASDLNQPLGMALLDDTFYIGVTDGVLAVPFEDLIQGKGKPKKITELPAGGYNNHWTRNILASRDGEKLYVSVGSGSNNAEHGMQSEKNRASILTINPDGSDLRVFAAGIRNPVGMDWEPKTGALWTAVNERDDLGDDLVPDFMTSVQEGGFYGWPYSYFGQNEDPRLKGQRPDLVAKAIVPDVPLGAHTASLGLAFYTDDKFPEKYRGGAFVGQHGSWNRSKLAGYRVAFVPFADGKPAGEPEDFLTGFISDFEKREVFGRPVGVAVAADGSLLVADDDANMIWRVVPEAAAK